MKLTRRGHYSVKAMLDLAMAARDRPIPVREIAARQSIPVPFLEKLLIQLRQAGLVRSVRGVHGGYRLRRSPKDISLGDILAAVGETGEPLPRLTPHASQPQDWVAFALWRHLDRKVRDTLYAITLEDLYFDACSWQAAQGQGAGFVV